jgi:hypothetical protein
MVATGNRENWPRNSLYFIINIMIFRKTVQHVKRYKDLAGLLIKYGRSDLAEADGPGRS